MRKLNLFLTLLFLAIFGIGNAWGAEGDTHDFAQSISQVLNNGASIQSIQISNQSYPIKTVNVSWRYNKSYNPAVTIEVSVGGTSWGTIDVGTSTSDIASFSGSSTTGEVVVSFTNHRTSSSGNGTFSVSNVQLVEGAGTPTTAYTVTFNAGTNGNCSTESLTEASAGAGVELPSCTANDGYKFIGWSTDENPTSANAGVAGDTYYPSENNTPLYAYYKQFYTVTIETPTNGTLAVTNNGNDVTSGESFVAGDILNIVATPADGYKFRNIQVVDASTHTFTASNTKEWTMGNHEITIEANFDVIPTYTVAFSVNGAVVHTADLKEGAAVTAPEVVVPAGTTKVFTGWIETATVEGETPAYVTPITTATKTVTYYAVFATKTPGSSTTTTDVLNQTWSGITATSYTSFSDKNAPTSEAVFAGKIAGGNSSIQLRNNSGNKTPSYEGIITTTSGGRAKKITVVWESHTADDRKLNVYGKNTAYTSVQNIFQEENQGTLLGSIVNGTSTELNITGDYEYIALGSDAGAMYLTSISIVWENGTPDTYSDFTTTPGYSLTTADNDFYSLYLPYDVTIPVGVEVYTGELNEEETTLTLHEVTNKIPAETAVLVKSTEDVTKPKAYSFEYTTDATAIEDNSLEGVLVETLYSDLTPDGKTLLTLNTGSAGVGFYQPKDGAETLKANRAYLLITTPVDPAPVRIVMGSQVVTGLENAAAAQEATKLFINGQLYIVRDGKMYDITGRLAE